MKTIHALSLTCCLYIAREWHNYRLPRCLHGSRVETSYAGATVVYLKRFSSRIDDCSLRTTLSAPKYPSNGSRLPHFNDEPHQFHLTSLRETSDMLPCAASGSGSGSGHCPGSGSSSGKAPARSFMLRPAAIEETIAFAQAGSRMREWMFMTPEELAQAPGAPREATFAAQDLKTWGWTRLEAEPAGKSIPYANTFNGLKGV